MKRFLAKFFITICLIFLFAGCGIEAGYYSLSEPSASHSPSGTDQEAENYWEFTVPHNYNETTYSGYYKGVVVYYKIYNNISTMNSHISAIYTANDNTNSTQTYDNEGGFNKLNSSSYAYKRLYTSGDVEFLNLNKSSDVRIKIRLVDEGDFDKSIFIAGSDTGVYPYRSSKYDNKQSFEFDSDYYPKSGDEDAVIDTEKADEEGKWYINAYAVCIAQNDEFQTYHSRLCHLGYITIKQKD